MRRAAGGQSQGYTIVETLIFLAVSGAMFISAAAFINGRQSRAEFSTGVRDFESVIGDVANDVSNGYFGTSDGLSCSINPDGSIRPSTGSTMKLGSNGVCMFIGKALQLAPSDGPEGSSNYATIPLVGRQFNGTSYTAGYASDYTQTKVEPISTSRAISLLPGRPTIDCAFYLDTDTANIAAKPCNTEDAIPAALIAFMTRLEGGNASGDNGSSQVKVFVVADGFETNRSPDEAKTALRNLENIGSRKDPEGGVYICLKSGGSDQHALIKLGGTGSQFSTDATINSGDCK